MALPQEPRSANEESRMDLGKKAVSSGPFLAIFIPTSKPNKAVPLPTSPVLTVKRRRRQAAALQGAFGTADVLQLKAEDAPFDGLVALGLVEQGERLGQVYLSIAGWRRYCPLYLRPASGTVAGPRG